MAATKTFSFKPSYVVLLLAALAVVGLHQILDARVKLQEVDPNQSTLPSFDALKLCSGGFEKVLADIYWLDFVQYCGQNSIVDTRIAFRHAFDYVDLITRLDPHFKQPYWFGCWAIGYWQHRPDLADKIMQRGMENNPKDWYIPYLAGVNEFIFARDTHRAATYYRAAAKRPDAPAYLEREANLLDSPIPDYEKRLRTLWRLYADAKEPNLKQSTYDELVRVLKQMYRQAPTQDIRNGAVYQLRKLGLSDDEIRSQ